MLRNTWIKTSDQHFVDFNEDGTWVENDHCPNGPFLVGLLVGNNEKQTYSFEWYTVILTENGIMSVDCDDNTYYLGWEISEVEYWMVIGGPTDVAT